MQQATHPCLHVRDAHDAHVIFEAVRQGFLTPIVRRLNEMERVTLIRPGAIFVWFESEDESGLKRWTDGRLWGQSKMREPYLFYDEKLPHDRAQAASETHRPPAFRFVDGVARPGPSSSALSHQNRATEYHPGLVKQAYSVWVLPNPHARMQKWHLTAYFTYADLPHLPTIEHDPLLKKIIVPTGVYRIGNTRPSRSNEGESSGHDRLPNNPFSQNVLPPLSSIHSNHPPAPKMPRVHGARSPEDQRLIQMLNSRHVM